MRWIHLLAHWHRWFTDPVRLYRESRLETIRLYGGPGDGDPYTVSLATRRIAIVIDSEGDGNIRPEGQYTRAGHGRFQWTEAP